MGGKSRSSTATTQSTTNVQDIDTTTIGLEDVEFGVAGVSGDVSITQVSTDQGSIDAGRRIGEASLDFAGEFGSTALKESFDFGRESLGTVERGISEAIDFGTGIASDAFSFGEKALLSSEATQRQASSTLGKAIDQAAAATRSDTADTTVKVIGYIAAAVVAAIIGFAIFARR